MEKDNRANRYPPETRARAVRMVFEHQRTCESPAAAIKAIAPKIGCGRDTLRRWVHQEETDTGHRDSVTPEERARILELEREVREPWSNGQTEGQVNRLKTPKLQMYGRANIDLLRARLVAVS